MANPGTMHKPCLPPVQAGFSPSTCKTWLTVIHMPLLNLRFTVHHAENQGTYNKLECGPMPNVMAALPNIGGALCESSVNPFLVLRRKVCLTLAVGVPSSNAANIGEGIDLDAVNFTPAMADIRRGKKKKKEEEERRRRNHRTKI